MLVEKHLEICYVVFLDLGACHGIHHFVHDGVAVNRVLVVLVLGVFGVYAHERCHERGHIDRFGLYRDRIGRQGVLLNPVNIVVDTGRYRQYQRNADYADAACKGCEYRAPLFGHEVIQRQRERCDIAHCGLALHRLRNLIILRRIRHRIAGYQSVLKPDCARSVAVGKLGIVRDHDDELILGYLLEYLHDLHACFRIESARRLVGQKNVRVVNKCTGDCNALHLAAGHLVRLLAELIAKPDLLKRFDCTLAPL